jgi:predicted tellurium resistance membrane protein TerC
MHLLTDPQAWIALVTLTVLEVVLGIDNIIFISILAGRLPEAKRASARRLGLAAAMLTRIALLLSITWLARLTAPLFTLPVVGRALSGRDLVLGAGGLFLIAKSVHEIHNKLEGDDPAATAGRAAVSFASVILQIMVLDIVFSLDSVITAVGMAQQVEVMVAAVMLAVLFMLWFSGPVSRFVDAHPTVKMLALAFLILIGVSLVADSMGQHIPKGYIYFAMAFSVGVEMLNIRIRHRAAPVRLRGPHAGGGA